MRNKILLSLFAVFVLTLGFTAYAGTDTVDAENSTIVQLTDKTFKSETEKGLVFVDFWAAWCPPCRKMNPILEELATEQKDAVKIAKLNVDDYKALATDLKVSSIPTIIVFKDGKEVDRIIGLVEKSHLEKAIVAYGGK